MRNDFVATGYVLNREHTRLLMIFHRKLRKWLPPGGHLDKNEIPHECALREVEEETGIRAEILDPSPLLGDLEPFERQLPAPYVVLHETILATEHDEAHLHVDFCYLMEADETEPVVAAGEVSGAQWFSLEELLACDTFESIRKIGEKILRKES
jgi:8-oxo-dGTP diphosphatase